MNNNNKNSNNNFLIQGSILAIAGILVRLIGLAYRIPLRRIIGAEGMGYYSVAFEVYSVILLLSSYSLPLAVSKMISARLTKEDYINANRIFKAAMVYATIIGFIGCMFVFLSADWFANVFYKLPLCKYALISLAPTIWIMTYLGVLRGYYQGHSTMVPTALSQIIEQIVNAAVSVGAAYWLCHMALNDALGKSVASGYGAAGGTIGTGAGALSALILLIIMFLVGRKAWNEKVVLSEQSGVRKESYKEITKVLFLTIIPVILSTAVYNISGIIDSTIFANIMEGVFGSEASAVATDYGTYTGDFKTLTNIPIAIANALSSSLIVTMTTAVTNNDRKGVQEGITSALRFTVMIALPASVGLTVLGGPIVKLLFDSGELAATMTLIGSSAVLFFSISTVTNAILQGNGYMRLPVIHAFISLGIHIAAILIMLLVFKMGIFSIVIANIIFALSMCILNGYSMRKRIGYIQDVKYTYILPLICSSVMGIVTYAVRYLIEKYLTRSSLVVTFICLIVAVIVYIIMILITGCIRKEELKRFPIIRKFV